MLQEFKDFAVKGNVVDMGVGIVIGAAFTTIVKSFVADIVNPILGVFTGGIDFSGLFFNLSGEEVASATAAKDAGLAVITYGVFINAIISFMIVAFLVVRTVNKLRREDVPAPAPAIPPADVQLLTEIRDLLKARAA
jgi:large conductance mechanosensitive channel